MQFRGYSVDAVHRTVKSPSGAVVRLEPKAFDLLIYFTLHPEETLSRDQLVHDVWDGKFVTDDAVMVAVYALRQAFDDDARSPKFIETIRGRGYRWIANAAAQNAAEGGGAPRRFLVPALAAILASGIGALLWAALRPIEPMPSLVATNELIRAHARGVFFSERSTRRDLELARSEFHRAIRLDSRFAEPHAALAEVCVRLIEVGAPNGKEREAEARAEVAKALELAPRFALTQAAQASVQFVLDRDARRAERSFRYAIDLDPSLPDAHRRYSYLLSATGRFTEAAAQARMAVEMQPTSSAAVADLAWTELLAGHTTEAQRLYRDALQLDPSNVGILISLGFCQDLMNRPAEAIATYDRAMQIRGIPEERIAAWDRVFVTSGLRGVYGAWVDAMKGNREVPRFMLAAYAARAGQDAQALAFVRESAQRHEPGTLWLGVHPAFASLRGQREFAAVVASSFQTR